jgi:hypothetical protein
LDAPPPSFAYTSRDLFLGVALVAVLFGVYANFGLLFATPLLFAMASFVLRRIGRQRDRREYTHAGRFVMLPAIGLAFIALLAYGLLSVGPIYSPSNFPDEVHGIADIGGTDVGSAKVTCLGRFLDSDYVWRQPLPATKVANVASELHLEKIAPDRVSSRFFSSFPLIWRPTPTEQCEFYASPDFFEDLLGNDGDQYAVMYDPDSQLVYIWNRFRF